jgi:hypothetical protein
MKILIDTNIFIPLEITSLNDIEPNQNRINEFYTKCNRSGFSVFLHPAIKNDVNRDTNNERKKVRLQAINKYPLLDNVKYSEDVKEKIGLPSEKTHNFVDYHLLNAVYINAVNILVSNDKDVHKRAKDLDISDKVYYLDDVDVLFQSIEIEPIKLFPNIKVEKCFNVNLSDEIFDSIRADYKGFDNWYKTKCQLEHRSCYIIKEENHIDGIAIYKKEDEINELAKYNMDGKVLKICTFKTSKRVSGNKFGELLLRSIFDFCYLNNFEYIYVTAFEQNIICSFLENFGFERHNKSKDDTGEVIYIKRLLPDNNRHLSSFQYHMLYGPKYYSKESTAFLVPIKPIYHEKLFPELEQQTLLFPYKEACSNGIRKAYICLSNTNKIKEGDILYFYRSQDFMKIQAIGITEKIIRTTDINEIISITARRTVFTIKEINETYGNNKEVLVILFRQTNSLSNAITLEDLGIDYYPQCITQVKQGLI